MSQIVTPDLQPEGDLSLSLQIQDARVANPYEIQAELGLTKWAEVAVFQGFKPDEEIFATEFGVLTKEPFLPLLGLLTGRRGKMWHPNRISKRVLRGA